MDIAEIKKNFLKVQEKGWFYSGAPKALKFPPGKSPKGYREAAVLFLIDKELRVMINKRSMSVGSYKGQACLPGGSVERSDQSLISTALREAQEEVDLNPRDVEVICTLPPTFTIVPSMSLVTPVVAITKVDPRKLDLQPDPAEVDSIYWVPLEFFISSPNVLRRTKLNIVYGLNFTDPNTNVAHFIYGLTALICMTLSSIALQRPVATPEFEPYFIKEISRDEQSDSIVLCSSRVNTVIAIDKISKL